ncbi:putative OPA3-like protein CG13603 [Belonocnema kinseyi]|uniref:putative OPA3-like protein CG13603 n=1 Tax=Belonocnema kinseyi TaxID=2817044 RepID=UPI00143D9450|nr:putative OPA3-like protein CG13603 [Belonocnema kinseyi]XP_033218040.1 putative OPA3-like protein CG13603 [Belonocnema kinseyi]XP_033218041.1 putative OPA3-like protein CG13603 [Belonocnema kinseyi]XP_033218042.1 putative OPA3-like protein CG13603 [Belonocnema kinseyi]
MVVGVFPALKLGVLFIKQISKPLAKMLVTQAKNHHVFRTYFIIPPAQFYHWAEVKAKMYVMNLGKPTKVAKLNEAMAIELGANLVGEIIIFTVAGGCLILEYNRQATKEAKKEEIRQMQLEKFTADIQALFETTQVQEAEIKYLNNVVTDMAKKNKVKLPEKIVPVPAKNQVETNNNLTMSQLSEKEREAETERQSIVHRAIASFKKEDSKDDKLS